MGHPLSTPARPGRHTQAEELVEPELRVVKLEAQGVQLPGPSVSLNVPTGQMVHTRPVAPEYPAGHWHMFTLLLAGLDVAPLGQAVHTCSDPFWKLLAGQGEQPNPLLSPSPTKPARHLHTLRSFELPSGQPLPPEAVVLAEHTLHRTAADTPAGQ